MYMPDEFDGPPDNLDDLIDMEHEMELEMLREREQAETDEALLMQFDEEVDSQLKENAPPVSTTSQSQLHTQHTNSNSVVDHDDDVISKSPSAKRQKMIDNNVLDEISNIRRDLFRASQIEKKKAVDVEENLVTSAKLQIPRFKDLQVFRRIPENSDYLPVTTTEGSRYYLKLLDESTEPEPRISDVISNSSIRRRTGLCGVPYLELLEQATMESSRLIQTDIEIESESGYESNSHGDSSDDGGVNVDDLWVEKFRPKSYLQLLSDDGTNRTLLRWLKLWDKLVFGIDKKPRMPKHEVTAKPDEGKGKWTKSDGADGKKWTKTEGPDGTKWTPQPSASDVIEELDENGRPKQRVALLHGPPGLGKTTLSHVVAKHAGYNVVEMNASDDRSVEAFKVRLEAATQMRSVSDSDKRPNCLIIDEIDGAPAATIQFLVGLITGTGKSSGKKKSSSAPNLQRPIICICNDLYTPSLRALRQHALVIQFPPTLSQRLAERLLTIASRERMQTDLTALLALCEKTGDDIRACLSTLQFFKSRGKRLQLTDVHKSHVGQKDVQKSYFTVWDEIFRTPRTGKRKVDSVEVNVSSPAFRFRNILHTVQSSGDYEKLQQGVFENYLNVKFKDLRMENVGLGQDWFCFFDMANYQIASTQNYSVMAYLSYTFIMTHFLFSTLQKSRLAYPSMAAEKRNAEQKSKHILESLVAEMTPTTRAFNSVSSLVHDTLPYILAIMQPNLRPVNTHLYSQREKKDLQNLVDLLIAFNLNFVQERLPDGSFTYRLEPNVEEVIFFPEMQHKALPYAIKQMIAHEVEMEHMRRKEGPILETAASAAALKNPAATATPEVIDPKSSKATGDQLRSMEELTRKLQAKDVQVKDRIAVDFFGRPVNKVISGITNKFPTSAGDAATLTMQAETDGIVSSDVWFKFKEGYNNAVRKNIRVKDLL